MALPNALASPAPGLGLKAWTAANAAASGSIATLGGEAQGGPARPIVPRAVGPHSEVNSPMASPGKAPLPRVVRRTGEARGRLLEALGLYAFLLSASLAAGAPALGLAFPGEAHPLTVHLLPLASLPLTLAVWAATRRRLARHRAGQADPQGEERVRSAAGLCRAALAASLLGCLAAALARALLLALS